MASRRRRSRELAIKALYQADLVAADARPALEDLFVVEILEPLMGQCGRELAHARPGDDADREEPEPFAAAFTREFCECRAQEGAAFSLPAFIHRSAGPLREGFDLSAFIEQVREKVTGAEAIVAFSRDLIGRTVDHLPDINRLLGEFAEHWSLDRMASMDRAILRLAVGELLYFPEIPANVTLNEAIELAKKYSTERSAEFVNGILDRVNREKKPAKVEARGGPPRSRARSKEPPAGDQPAPDAPVAPPPPEEEA